MMITARVRAIEAKEKVAFYSWCDCFFSRNSYHQTNRCVGAMVHVCVYMTTQGTDLVQAAPPHRTSHRMQIDKDTDDMFTQCKWKRYMHNTHTHITMYSQRMYITITYHTI